MTITQRTDDVLLDVASSANGRLHDLAGIDPWTSARVLIRLLLVLIVASQLAMTFEGGFAWGNMLILSVWMWHYAVTANGIERYARSPHGSNIARITERPHRSMYPFIYAALAPAEMPPASRRTGRTTVLADA